MNFIIRVSAHMKPVLGLLAFILLSNGVALAIKTEKGFPTPREVEIIKAEFGLFNPPGSGKPPFVPTRTVSLTENQTYGWMILLKTNKVRIKWREEFTLPSPPTTWGDAGQKNPQSVSEDKRVSVVEREVEPEGGVIYNAWGVAPGDPAGRYIIRVIIENTLERVFEFDVQ